MATIYGGVAAAWQRRGIINQKQHGIAARKTALNAKTSGMGGPARDVASASARISIGASGNAAPLINIILVQPCLSPSLMSVFY